MKWMKLHAARGVALVLAYVLASVCVVPCACAEMTAPAGSGDGHCGPVGPGLRAMAADCSCACMTARDEESTTARVERGLGGSTSVHPGSDTLVARSYHVAAPIPPRRVGHSPAPSMPSILRI